MTNIMKKKIKVLQDGGMDGQTDEQRQMDGQTDEQIVTYKLTNCTTPKDPSVN